MRLRAVLRPSFLRFLPYFVISELRQKLSVGHKYDIIMLRRSPEYKDMSQAVFSALVSKLYQRKITRKMIQKMLAATDIITAAASVADLDPYSTYKIGKQAKAKIANKMMY